MKRETKCEAELRSSVMHQHRPTDPRHPQIVLLLKYFLSCRNSFDEITRVLIDASFECFVLKIFQMFWMI